MVFIAFNWRSRFDEGGSGDLAIGSSMGSEIADRVVLVTGGARRVGAAICRHLHQQGARILVHYHHSAAEAENLCSEFNRLRENSAAALGADLLAAGALPTLAQQARARFGRVDGLVNNASTFYETPWGQVTEAAWDDLIGTNFKVPLFLAQALAPDLRQVGGSIVNIIDIHAELPLPKHVVYTAAKGGLLALTRALARELGPEVRVNGVSPGAILWPDDPAWDSAERRAQVVAHTLLQRCGEPSDIAQAVGYLLSATYVTGQIIAVDGGRSLALA
jgi:pteridine reductase